MLIFIKKTQNFIYKIIDIYQKQAINKLYLGNYFYANLLKWNPLYTTV